MHPHIPITRLLSSRLGQVGLRLGPRERQVELLSHLSLGRFAPVIERGVLSIGGELGMDRWPGTYVMMCLT